MSGRSYDRAVMIEMIDAEWQKWTSVVEETVKGVYAAYCRRRRIDTLPSVLRDISWFSLTAEIGRAHV